MLNHYVPTVYEKSKLIESLGAIFGPPTEITFRWSAGFDSGKWSSGFLPKQEESKKAAFDEVLQGLLPKQDVPTVMAIHTFHPPMDPLDEKVLATVLEQRK